MEKVFKTPLLPFVALLIAVISVPGAFAATIAYSFDQDTIVTSDLGPEIINGYEAKLTLTILTNNSEPFNVTNVPGADDINVTIQFLDSLGSAVDVTGDGAVDTFTATENASQPGVYHAYINTSARPGEYTMRMRAVAYNTTTGVIIDEGTVDTDVFIADPYWVTVWMEENEKLTLGSLSFELNSINDRGAVVVLGDSLKTLSPDSTTGEIYTQVDIDGDGLATDWMFIKSSDGGLHEVAFFSRNNILPEEPESKVTVSGDTITREEWIKSRRNYRQLILWDQSPTSFLKAVDYYIIPAKGSANWKEEWGSRQSGKITVVKRTTWLGLLSSDEKVFEGNLYRGSSNTRTFSDDILTLFGKWAGNYANLGSFWEIAQAKTLLKYPADYELKFGRAAVPAELELRGKWTMPSIFGESVDWNALVTGNSTLY